MRQIARRIAVMHPGELVGTIATEALAAEGPRHPYTAALIAAVLSTRTAGATP